MKGRAVCPPLRLTILLALASGRRVRLHRAAQTAGKIPVEPGSTVVSIVSGGNAAAKVASAILAEADED